jgi:hypothetical protein
MSIKNTVYPLLALAVLVGASLACGDSNTGTKVGTIQSETAAPAKIEVFRVGDVVQANNHTIVLNRAGVQGGALKANFTIENTGSDDLAVSSLLSFSAKDSEGSKLEQDIFDCGSSSLDGKVLPGDKLKGDICWKTSAAGVFRIYYEPSLLGSGAVVWEVRK